MISHGKDIKIFTGNANPALAQEICKIIGTKLGEAEVKSFADGEASVSLYETVRGSDVFLINSTCKPVNDSLMELLIMIDACKRASAGRVTAVIPYFGYARQDRKAKSRDPISAKLVANMLTAAGADRVLTMDLHASQIQGFFDIPVDNLLGNPVFVDYYAKKFGEKCEDMVVVSPDVGSVARARTFAQKLHMNLAIVDKRRQKANQCEVMNVIGDVAGKDCILFDDMVDTAGSSLAPLLDRQLTAEGGYPMRVDEMRYCEEGGVEAAIRGETVLMGSAYFMKKRHVSLPRDLKLQTGLFLAVDGVLTAVFAVKYQPSRNAEWALRAMRRSHITPVLAVRSSNVTPGLIKRKFGVDAKVVYPDVSTRLALAQLAAQQGETPNVIVCREGLLPLAESVVGSRRMVRAVRTATVLGYIGSLCGVLLSYYLTSVGNFAVLTPLAMVVFLLLWLLPTLLIAGLVRHF